ncbi:MAG: acyl--CoA ligase [Paracoccaceae bacterium]|nr:MAG: acyl--CoA ligase [Paracoccaceae bacterium]
MLSIHAEGAPPALPAAMNLAAHVLAGATAHPERSALQLVGPQRAERWSYARLVAAVRGCGAALLAQGLAPGDRVLMRLGNTPDFPVVFLGAIAAGLVPVPTSAQLTAAEVEKLVPVIGPRLIVAGPGVAVPGVVPCPVLASDALRGAEDRAPCDWAMGPPDRLAYIVFTSGTSGRPSAVMHAHRAIIARTMMRDGWEGLGQGDRLMHAGAFNWTYTLGTGLMDPWAAGATALIPLPGTEPAQLPLLLKRHDATIFAAAPGVFRPMLRAGLPALPRLRHALAAGESLSPDLRAEWRAATGTDIHEALGMSEISTFVSGSPARPAPEGHAGFPQPGRRVAVLDDAGMPVPVGQPGVLAIDRRDPGLFMGYLGDAAATAARFRDTWFVTGDRVAMQPDGAIAYLGRDDDMMNAGGFRVSPLEVETAAAGFPGLAEAAAVEHAVRPGVSVIALAYSGLAPLDETALETHLAQRLARYKQPRLFRHLPALPRTANGKLNRRAVRDLLKDPAP